GSGSGGASGSGSGGEAGRRGFEDARSSSSASGSTSVSSGPRIDAFTRAASSPVVAGGGGFFTVMPGSEDTRAYAEAAEHQAHGAHAVAGRGRHAALVAAVQGARRAGGAVRVRAAHA